MPRLLLYLKLAKVIDLPVSTHRIAIRLVYYGLFASFRVHDGKSFVCKPKALVSVVARTVRSSSAHSSREAAHELFSSLGKHT